MSAPVIIVTGASRGLGQAIVSYLLLHSSSKLVLVSRSEEPLAAIKQSNPGRVEYVAADVAKDETADKVVKKAIDAFGTPDSVIVNHGVLDPVAKVADADMEAWKKHFDINFFGAVAMAKAAIPHLRKSHGRIVFVSSGAATTPYLAWCCYGAAKAALNHLNATIAAEEPNITAISIRPGVVDTQMQTDIRSVHKEAMGEGNERFQELYKEGKLLKPEQPGNVVAKLALRAEKDLSGQFLSWNANQLADYQE
ncbi:hypothetical protein FN846DRAFT_990920 [Sphaerosporella brunnea]|uniref:Short-chain dehydrogenase n=1 Tax=Sphaerosporella brunnea TaxID=1250544 RepID=A0A5J5ER39_9PEZI|nr:hypothetical protein FN846DRAFT_990920 [Sphaerosporella brunnea]